MPKVNMGRSKYEKLSRLIGGYTEETGKLQSELAAACGLSVKTFQHRLKNTGSFELDELLRLCRRLGVPIDELRTAITY